MKEILKEHFVLLLGIGLFTFGLFSFSSGYHSTKGFLRGFDPYPVTTYYYYNPISLVLLTIGVIFIVIGLLKIRKKKGEN